ncbi:MAG: hypothetical protein J2P41_13975, partial [Blastocatellia bacterium]|nr:hypothetical protein [Blastocatellia bacterium]
MNNRLILIVIVFVMVLLSVSSMEASAHEGPPFPIIVDKNIGPCVLSVWADPDVGIGTFFIILDPLPGKTVPEGLAIEVGAQPTSGRL